MRLDSPVPPVFCPRLLDATIRNVGTKKKITIKLKQKIKVIQMNLREKILKCSNRLNPIFWSQIDLDEL